MLLFRALNRGYGLSRYRWPMQDRFQGRPWSNCERSLTRPMSSRNRRGKRRKIQPLARPTFGGKHTDARQAPIAYERPHPAARLPIGTRCHREDLLRVAYIKYCFNGAALASLQWGRAPMCAEILVTTLGRIQSNYHLQWGGRIVRVTCKRGSTFIQHLKEISHQFVIVPDSNRPKVSNQTVDFGKEAFRFRSGQNSEGADNFMDPGLFRRFRASASSIRAGIPCAAA